MNIKKIISATMAIIAMATVSPMTSSAYVGNLYAGDADQDGNITAMDATLIFKEAARISSGEYPTIDRYFTDADYDGNVTAKDASLVLKRYARMATLPKWAAKFEPYYHWHDDDTFVATVNGETIPCIDIMISDDNGTPFAEFTDHNGVPYVAVGENFSFDIDTCYWTLN